MCSAMPFVARVALSKTPNVYRVASDSGPTAVLASACRSDGLDSQRFEGGFESV